MPKVVTLRVVRGEPQRSTVYAIYFDGAKNVLSRRLPPDLGWTSWQTSGLRDRSRVDLVGLVRTLGAEKIMFTHVYPCGPIMVVQPGDDTFGQPEVIDLEVEDA